MNLPQIDQHEPQDFIKEPAPFTSFYKICMNANDKNAGITFPALSVSLTTSLPQIGDVITKSGIHGYPDLQLKVIGITKQAETYTEIQTVYILHCETAP